MSSGASGNTKLWPSASPRGESWLGHTCSSGREHVGGLLLLAGLLMLFWCGCWKAFRPSFVGLSQPPESSDDVGGLVVVRQNFFSRSSRRFSCCWCGVKRKVGEKKQNFKFCQREKINTRCQMAESRGSPIEFENKQIIFKNNIFINIVLFVCFWELAWYSEICN